jgi:mRNA (guanine-N7-)-methyltransferase
MEETNEISSLFINAKLEDLLDCINNNDFKVKNPPHNLSKKEFEKYINKKNEERRNNSTVIMLRDFHNFIKKTLICNVANLYRANHSKQEKIHLLDLAVGKGGDMAKWNKAKIYSVFGLDKSNESINSIDPFNQGAKERLRNASWVKTKIHYTVADATNPSLELKQEIESFIKNNLFQIISCQFALHYFFQSEIALENVFRFFSPFLKKGGYFIGTSTDSTKITNLLGKNKSFNSTLLSITKNFKAQKPKLPFGNSYTFRLNDTFDGANYFNSMGESTEYLTNMDVLIQMAAKYNLQPVFLNLFEQPYSILHPGRDDKRHFLTFEQIYGLPEHGGWLNEKRNNQLNDDEIIINGLYTTFIFIKT